ncbi:MAG: hypothetical protein HDR72_06840 [Ruminococcaceae bacterium]|nr:hypothetical protein [Oscillospiraceae bacterium]
MNNTLEEILGGLEPNELDELFPNEFGAELPNGALRRIEKKTLQKTGLKSKKRRCFDYRIWAPIAACLLLTVSLTGVAAEAREYNAAVDFFAENGLSAEGLSRGDIKAVYRDISTNRFTNDKTAEVIRRSVQGVELPEPTPEELAEFWNVNKVNNSFYGSNRVYEGITYAVYNEYKFDSSLGFDVFDKSIVECCRDESPLWNAKFSFCVEGCIADTEGTAVWGFTPTWSSELPSPAWLARLDDNGNKLWEHQLNHGFENEYIAEVLDNGDGTLAVISRGDLEYLCLSQYDMNGNELSFKKTRVGNKGIWNAVRLGDGYLVQLGSYLDGEHAHLAKLDRDGNITDNFVYESDDCDYHITDMAEFEGKVYLSAYAVPKQNDGSGYEIANILDQVFAMNSYDISNEELTPLVRDNYTAVLLLCDPEGGEPETFYSVKGSLGGKLDVGDTLKWDTERVFETFYSPYTSSLTIGGTCRVYRYSFDKSGVLVERDDTGETTSYRR